MAVTFFLGRDDVLFRAKLLQKLLFLGVDLRRHPNAYSHKLISAPMAVEVRHAAISHPQHPPRRCARVDGQLRLAGERWDFDLPAECCHRETDIEIVDNVITAAAEVLMWLFFDEDNQVTRGTTTLPGIALALHALGKTLEMRAV